MLQSRSISGKESVFVNTGPTLLEVENLTKSYDGRTLAVDHLTLRVPSGQIYGFLGPNGAGKTTTIKAIVGLLRPDSGTVRIAGVDVLQDVLHAKRLIGYIPDTPMVYDRLTGIEYLNFIADVFGVPQREREERLAVGLSTFQLEEAATKLISTYSHGMKHKLLIVAALVHQPRVLILDEPMGGLDPRAWFRFKQLLRQHCDAGNAVFLSTHVLDIAERLCDRLAIINKGRLVAEGTLDELRSSQHEKSSTLEQLFLQLTGEGDQEWEQKQAETAAASASHLDKH